MDFASLAPEAATLIGPGAHDFSFDRRYRLVVGAICFLVIDKFAADCGWQALQLPVVLISLSAFLQQALPSLAGNHSGARARRLSRSFSGLREGSAGTTRANSTLS